MNTFTKRIIIAACLLVSAGAGGVGIVLLGGGTLQSPVSVWQLVVSLGVCLTTALVEELVFRGVGIPLALRIADERKAVWGTALVFGLCHIVGWAQTAIASAFSQGAIQADHLLVVLPCIAARLVQTFAFGLIAGALFVKLRKRVGSFAWPMSYLACVVFHFAYDAVYLGPALAVGVALEPAASLPYLVVLLVSGCMLLVACYLMRDAKGRPSPAA